MSLTSQRINVENRVPGATRLPQESSSKGDASTKLRQAGSELPDGIGLPGNAYAQTYIETIYALLELVCEARQSVMCRYLTAWIPLT